MPVNTFILQTELFRPRIFKANYSSSFNIYTNLCRKYKKLIKLSLKMGEAQMIMVTSILVSGLR